MCSVWMFANKDFPTTSEYYPAECFYYERKEQQLDENNSIPLIKD